MAERGSDVLRREDRVLLADLVNRVSGFPEVLDGLDQNPRAGDDRFAPLNFAVSREFFQRMPDLACELAGRGRRIAWRAGDEFLRRCLRRTRPAIP
jgi:hypothetical protein